MFNDVYSNFYSEEKSKEYLGDMLGKLTNLKELELNVSKLSKIFNFYKILWNICCSNKISDVGMIEICQALQKLTDLRKLKFFFEKFQFSQKIQIIYYFFSIGATPECFPVLGKAISTLKQITNLNLSFK